MGPFKQMIEIVKYDRKGTVKREKSSIDAVSNAYPRSHMLIKKLSKASIDKYFVVVVLFQFC